MTTKPSCFFTNEFAVSDGAECWMMSKRDVDKVNKDLYVKRWMWGIGLKDRIRNEHFKGI